MTETDADDRIAYEIADWTDEQRADLVAALNERGIDYSWDEEGDLVVPAASESTIETIIDELEEGAFSDVDDDTSEATYYALYELFTGCDLLFHNPASREGRTSVDLHAEVVVNSRAPYGFPPQAWRSISDQARALFELIERSHPEDLAISVSARALRDEIRPYV
jgi:hypothetical protein